MKIYLYLYYRLYTWNLKKWGMEDMPHYNALFGVSFMMFSNLYLLAWLLQLFGLNIVLHEETPRFEVAFIGLIILFYNYFRFIYKKKFKSLVKLYSKESKQRRRRNTFLLWLYFLLSFLFILLTIQLYKNFN